MKLPFLNKVALISITISLLFSCASVKSQDNEIVLNYANESMNTLQVELVDTMIKGYENRQLSALNEKFKFDDKQGDAKYIEFDLETLKKFIYHVEMNGKKIDDTLSDKDLGIRMYYATYPKFTEWKNHPDLQNKEFLKNPLTKQYGLRHTLVMRPIMKKNGKNILFTSKPVNTGSSQQSHKTFALSIAPIDGQNHGSLSPPFKK